MEIQLRGFAEQTKDGRWYVHCIDLSLDAIGETYPEARGKLDDAIILYLDWAIDHGEPWIRKSRLSFRLRYVRAWAKTRLQELISTIRRSTVPAGSPESEFVTHPALPQTPLLA